MARDSGVQPENYDPNTLIDELIVRTNVANDAALARRLGYPREMISKIRHKKVAVGASMLVAMHETSGLSIVDLRALMGDFRDKWGNINLTSV